MRLKNIASKLRSQGIDVDTIGEYLISGEFVIWLDGGNIIIGLADVIGGGFDEEEYLMINREGGIIIKKSFSYLPLGDQKIVLDLGNRISKII